jgi:hypothetical protein
MLDKNQLFNSAIEDAEPPAMVREFTCLSTKSLGCRERPARPPTPLDSANKDANAPTYSASPVSLSDTRRKSDSRQRGPLSLVRHLALQPECPRSASLAALASDLEVHSQSARSHLVSRVWGGPEQTEPPFHQPLPLLAQTPKATGPRGGSLFPEIEAALA